MPVLCRGLAAALLLWASGLAAQAPPFRTGDGAAVLDIDHFERVNDSYGHAAGDQVLKVVVERLRDLVRDLVREQDAVVRWGGEEFLLVLPGTPPEGLQMVAAKALNALGREAVTHEGVEIAVRASAGAIAGPAWPAQSGPGPA